MWCTRGKEKEGRREGLRREGEEYVHRRKGYVSQCVWVCGSITTYFLTIFGSSIRVIWEGEREDEDVEDVVICDKLKHSPHLHYRMTVDLDNFVMAL